MEEFCYSCTYSEKHFLPTSSQLSTWFVSAFITYLPESYRFIVADIYFGMLLQLYCLSNDLRSRHKKVTKRDKTFRNQRLFKEWHVCPWQQSRQRGSAVVLFLARSYKEWYFFLCVLTVAFCKHLTEFITAGTINLMVILLFFFGGGSVSVWT